MTGETIRIFYSSRCFFFIISYNAQVYLIYIKLHTHIYINTIEISEKILTNLFNIRFPYYLKLHSIFFPKIWQLFANRERGNGLNVVGGRVTGVVFVFRRRDGNDSMKLNSSPSFSTMCHMPARPFADVARETLPPPFSG